MMRFPVSHLQIAPRRNSGTREMEKRKSTNGLTVAQKQAQVEEALNALKDEKAAWANSGKVGSLGKEEMVSGLFGSVIIMWKPMFFMLNMVKSELEIYTHVDPAGLVGLPRGKPKEVFKINPDAKVLVTSETKKRGNPFRFHIVVRSESEVLMLRCGTEQECKNWTAAIVRCVHGYKPSAALQDSLARAEGLIVHGGEEVPMHDEYDDSDISKLPLQAQEQLAQLDALYITCILSKAEFDQLRSVIFAQAKEMMAQTGNSEAYDPFPLLAWRG
jgi:hypothetical protein